MAVKNGREPAERTIDFIAVCDCRLPISYSAKGNWQYIGCRPLRGLTSIAAEQQLRLSLDPWRSCGRGRPRCPILFTPGFSQVTESRTSRGNRLNGFQMNLCFATPG